VNIALEKMMKNKEIEFADVKAPFVKACKEKYIDKEILMKLIREDEGQLGF